MSVAGDAVCEGWLRKSPPEKKLRRYAWKRRWFVLRSGRLSGEPDVLQYYKNPQSRRPIRTIDLNLCEQVDAGLSFTKKELESSFVFDLRTEERTWYLVAESEEDMNRWVTSICLLCGFNPTEDVSGRTSSSSINSNISMVTGLVPPPYDPVRVRRVDSAHRNHANYVPMTAGPAPSSGPGDPPSLGKQIPPPAHMGFRKAPLTAAVPNTMSHTEATPPPIHRNLKPQRVKPAPLDMTSVLDWQEVPPPVRSPVTRTFTRDPSSLRSARPSSGQSSSPSSDSDDPDDNYVAMTTSSLIKLKKLALALAFPLPCEQKRSGAEGERIGERPRANEERARGGRARVDYVVVDPKRTKALRNTREAWHDGRKTTEKEK
uniref:GRB2-associated-binding protein 1-like n=1 Tax=Gouania willdenowi TaxID=441366 RepID=A0A8C5GI07_GOUWI